MNISAKEAFMLLKTAKAVIINHAASIHLTECHSGEYTVDGSFLLEGTDIEQGYSFLFEEGDQISLSGTTILLEDVSGVFYPVELLVRMPLKQVQLLARKKEKFIQVH